MKWHIYTLSATTNSNRRKQTGEMTARALSPSPCRCYLSTLVERRDHSNTFFFCLFYNFDNWRCPETWRQWSVPSSSYCFRCAQIPKIIAFEICYSWVAVDGHWIWTLPLGVTTLTVSCPMIPAGIETLYVKYSTWRKTHKNETWKCERQ